MSIDLAFATLVVCWKCNLEIEDRSIWPEARQLAILMSRAPDDYCLKSYNELVNPNAPNRIEQHEVDAFLMG